MVKVKVEKVKREYQSEYSFDLEKLSAHFASISNSKNTA
jgi:hypothetical protein